MKSASPQVIAAIPNYNMAMQLKTLLPSVLTQNYDAVYVLDDQSNDDSISVVESFGDSVQLVSGKVNLGAGGNRNRILDVIKSNAIIHFIDADITYEQQNTADIIRKMKIDNSVGFIGGLVYDSSGKQSIWNYGPRQTVASALSATILWACVDTWLYSLIKPFYKHRPIIGQPYATKNIYWALEANLVICTDTLRQLGGFDESIREHDIQALAYEAEKQGLRNVFDPSFAVTQHTVKVRTYNRNTSKHKAELYLARKYGIWRWLLSLPSKNIQKDL